MKTKSREKAAAMYLAAALLSAAFAAEAAEKAAVAAAVEEADDRTRTFISPVRVVWSGGGAKSSVRGADELAGRKHGQVFEKVWGRSSGCRLENRGDAPGVLLDFGREIHGGIQIGTSSCGHGAKLRVRFGESAGEAMADIGRKGACNDHAPRDIVLNASHMGQIEYGHSGFRFARIDLVSGGGVSLEYVRAVSVMRPMRRLGSFRSSDKRLDQVWETAVRTVHLCCQDYLWDGIKRDRLVWMGDTHPETRVILSVFGEAEVLKRSLDYAMATTPPDRWMNSIDTYTAWYLRNVYDWYMFTGDREYLLERGEYLKKTIRHVVASKCNGAGSSMPGFLDWPTQHNRAAVRAGSRGLYATGCDAAAAIAETLGDAGLAAECRALAAELRAMKLEPHGAKSAAALLALGGVRDPKEMFAEALGRNGHAGVSTFYGYYMLEAMSAAGENQRALDTVRDYWGGMLDMGATSFWEDFNLAWTNNASRVDELPAAGKKDIHGDFGEFCYKGYRHSLCHGWSGGPAAWCINHVLGIRALDAGCKTVEVKPFLGDLQWAEGSMALPGGRSVKVSVKKKPDGTLETSIDAPEGVRIAR